VLSFPYHKKEKGQIPFFPLYSLLAHLLACFTYYLSATLSAWLSVYVPIHKYLGAIAPDVVKSLGP
jgi:hypothetical protein